MTVRAERHDEVLVVTIDRPERRNALDGLTMEGLGLAFEEAEQDDAVRAVVLTGAGDKVFCAGADLRAEPLDREMRGPGMAAFQTRLYPKPFLVALNGAAVGGGFEIMLCADLVVAADHATFSVPEVKRGLVGAGCSTRLAARLPPVVAAELVLTGDPISAERALQLGLVNALAPYEQVVERTLELAGRVIANAPLALTVTKQLLAREQRLHDAAEWADIRAQAAPVFASEDAKEGRAAFAEKRPPRWTGR